jgi:hypothetical protein
MSTAILVGVVVALLGAAVAATVLPSRKHELAREAAPMRARHGPPPMDSAHAREN